MTKTKIQQLYDKIPSFRCKEGCTDCCDNWIQFAPEEEARCGGFDFCADACPKLKKNEGCTVYQNRPFICRLFAASEVMPCPHGFAPQKPLDKEETTKLLQEYLKLKKEQEEHHGKNGE